MQLSALVATLDRRFRKRAAPEADLLFCSNGRTDFSWTWTDREVRLTVIESASPRRARVALYDYAEAIPRRADRDLLVASSVWAADLERFLFRCETAA